MSYRVFLFFLTVSKAFPGFRLDFPSKKSENPGPGQILGVSYPKSRVYCFNTRFLIGIYNMLQLFVCCKSPLHEKGQAIEITPLTLCSTL